MVGKGIRQASYFFRIYNLFGIMTEDTPATDDQVREEYRVKINELKDTAAIFGLVDRKYYEDDLFLQDVARLSEAMTKQLISVHESVEIILLIRRIDRNVLPLHQKCIDSDSLDESKR
ncbi:MAG TPA: hypothetical protein VGJ42_05190 [Nitrososphaera sp.]